MTVEKRMRISGGELPWPVVDSVVDIADGHTPQIVKHAARAAGYATRVQDVGPRRSYGSQQ